MSQGKIAVGQGKSRENTGNLKMQFEWGPLGGCLWRAAIYIKRSTRDLEGMTANQRKWGGGGVRRMWNNERRVLIVPTKGLEVGLGWMYARFDENRSNM